MAYIFFSTSGEKLNVVKVLHKTQIWDKPEAIWLVQAQAIDSPSLSHEITW